MKKLNGGGSTVIRRFSLYIFPPLCGGFFIEKISITHIYFLLISVQKMHINP